jgi:hypothetical protein
VDGGRLEYSGCHTNASDLRQFLEIEGRSERSSCEMHCLSRRNVLLLTGGLVLTELPDRLDGRRQTYPRRASYYMQASAEVFEAQPTTIWCGLWHLMHARVECSSLCVIILTKSREGHVDGLSVW